ncbi:MAG: chromophore lyase CpcT/CpeT [Pseudomonadota bacterium]
MDNRRTITRRVLRLKVVILTLLLLPAPLIGSEQDPVARSLEEQFERFLSWFPGRYDSALQTRTDALDAVPAALRNYRRHSIFRRVDLPAFGEVVFYAEQYRDGDPEKVYRQRIYVMTLDHDRQAIRLRVHVPDEVEALRGAYREPSLLEGLRPDQTTVWDGCDLWWRRESNYFRGELDPGACRFDSEAFGQEIVLEEYLLLGHDEIQFADRGLALDGTYLFGMKGDTPNRSRAVRPFLCTLGAGDVQTTVWLHDQGGWQDTASGRLMLQRWNVGDGGVHDDHGLRLVLQHASGEVLAEEAAPTDAEMVSLKHESLQVVCQHAPEVLYADRRSSRAAAPR